MISFTGFLTEEKNLHLEHLEDEILNNGITGTRWRPSRLCGY